MQISQYRFTLTTPTAELIERYGEFDAEGRIKSFFVINEEIIGAIHSAAEWLKEGLFEGERLSDEWSLENPCAQCPDREGCGITCRRKHAFDKDVYGGLLCGRKPALIQCGTKGAKEEENMVRFEVRFEAPDALIFARSAGPMTGALRRTRNHTVALGSRVLSLRPWSNALYQMFILHPEGLTLASLAGENSKQFVRIYKSITESEVKVARLREQLASVAGLSHLLNNKLSELKAELKALGVAEIFIPRTEHYKSNNKPYYIPYLRDEK